MEYTRPSLVVQSFKFDKELKAVTDSKNLSMSDKIAKMEAIKQKNDKQV